MKAKTPDLALEKMKHSKDLTETLDQYVGHLKNTKGFTPINIKAHFFGVRKWLVTNRVNGLDWEYIGKPKISSRINDRIPNRDELRRILGNRISLRDKAFFLVASSSGLRLGTLASLKVENFKKFQELGYITVESGEHRKLGNGKSYFTFITPEAKEVLEDYLANRGSAKPEDPLFTKENGEPLSQYVTNISRTWRILLKRSSLAQKIKDHKFLELHGHVLRKYFQTKCKNAGIRSDYVDFWLGHHPTSASTYLNDSYFRPTLEENANEYRKAVSALQVFSKEDGTEKNLEEFEAMKQRLAEMEQWKEAVQKIISEKEFTELQWKKAHLEYEEQCEKTKSQEKTEKR
jgi:integrase